MYIKPGERAKLPADWGGRVDIRWTARVEGKERYHLPTLPSPPPPFSPCTLLILEFPFEFLLEFPFPTLIIPGPPCCDENNNTTPPPPPPSRPLSKQPNPCQPLMQNAKLIMNVCCHYYYYYYHYYYYYRWLHTAVCMFIEEVGHWGLRYGSIAFFVQNFSNFDFNVQYYGFVDLWAIQSFYHFGRQYSIKVTTSRYCSFTPGSFLSRARTQ